MLGVLGGMGPVATIDFMNKVVRNTPAKRDQDHIPMVVLQATNIPDRTAAIMGSGEDPLPTLKQAVRGLEDARVSLIAMPCNTAHAWYDALQAETSVPILHIVEAAANCLPADGGRVGVLATTGTVRAGLYQQRLAIRGVSAVLPTDPAQARVMRAIQLVKSGDVAQAREILTCEAETLANAGCKAIIMACTEIPLALADVDLDARLIDATEALAKAAVDACLAGSQAYRAMTAAMILRPV